VSAAGGGEKAVSIERDNVPGVETVEIYYFSAAPPTTTFSIEPNGNATTTTTQLTVVYADPSLVTTPLTSSNIFVPMGYEGISLMGVSGNIIPHSSIASQILPRSKISSGRSPT